MEPEGLGRRLRLERSKETEVSMKRCTFRSRLVLMAGVVLLLAGAVTASAQPMAKTQGKDSVRGWLRELKITDEELAKISDLIAKDEPVLAKARADIRVNQANIARLLLEAEPDRTAIAAELDKSLEAEKTIRMVQIDRQIQVKSIFGEKRWKTVLLIVKEARAAESIGRLKESFSRKGLTDKEAERWTKALLLLKNCL
jgi:Spy/CpxP family protein refolding chaperone